MTKIFEAPTIVATHIDNSYRSIERRARFKKEEQEVFEKLYELEASLAIKEKKSEMAKLKEMENEAEFAKKKSEIAKEIARKADRIIANRISVKDADKIEEILPGFKKLFAECIKKN